MVPTRQQAEELLHEYNSSPALINHALAVEGVMRHFAKKFGEDEEKWGIIGLLHDLDYEKYPDQHCTKSKEILESRDIEPDYVRAIISHGWGICSDVKPEHIMEKVLFTTDELTGLINAAAIMRPNKSVMDLEYKSLWKKYKSSSFAAGVDRSIIQNGSEMLGMELREVIEETILGMREVADKIGLAGE